MIPSVIPVVDGAPKLHAEIGAAYEHPWRQPDASTKTLAAPCAASPGQSPADPVDATLASRIADDVIGLRHAQCITRSGVQMHGKPGYPSRLCDAPEPVERLYVPGRGR